MKGRGRGDDSDVAFDRVLMLRHLAIFIAAVVAYLQRSKLGLGPGVAGIVVASASLNLACSFLHRRPQLRLGSEVASCVIGVGCWTMLAGFTGGVMSPFLAGLWLEIILAAMLFAISGIVAVTLTSILALSGLQVFRGAPDQGMTIALQSGFLAGMGGLAYLVAQRAMRMEQRLVRQRDALDERLRTVGEQLESEREVGRLGENVARLAHGLKNTVHSLRGFVALIEPTIADRGSGRAALEGLRTAIDDLESLARLSLETADDAGRDAGAWCSVEEVAERAVGELSFAHPEMVWTVSGGDGETRAQMAAPVLFEVLVTLLRNSTEAMGGRGRGSVDARRVGDEVRIAVRDEGPGIGGDALSRIFEPGYTTKPRGSGYGLFLARRRVSEAGGRLSASSDAGKGTVMEIALPAVKEPAGRIG